MKISKSVSLILFFILIVAESSCFAASHSRFSRDLDKAIDSIVNVFLSFSNDKNRETVYGNGNFVTKVKDFTAHPFNSVVATGLGEVDIYVSSKPNVADVSITTDDNLMQYVDIYVDDGTLYITKKGGKDVKATKRKIVVNTSELLNLSATGACKAVVYDVIANIFHAESHGASIIDLNGKIKRIFIETSGASKINTANVYAEEADVSCSGSSTVITKVSQRLNAEASGVCNVKYGGTPKKVKKSVSGSGIITPEEL